MQHFSATSFLVFIAFLLTHPLRGATIVYQNLLKNKQISTHTPLTGCNRSFHQKGATMVRFLLTHPSRGATRTAVFGVCKERHFYSHTPHGVQHDKSVERHNLKNFYSHTPHGVQQNLASIAFEIGDFYSHTPHGVQHNIRFNTRRNYNISTHTPLTGCNPVQVL